MDYCIWGILGSKLASSRDEVKTIDDLKVALLEAWDNLDKETLQKATGTWIRRLNACVDAGGGHFEFLM